MEARDYRLEVLLMSYHNPLNQRSIGQCCDNPGLAPCQSSTTCSKCDPYFTITATGSDLSYTTGVYWDSDFIYFPGILYLFYGNDSIWLVSFIGILCCSKVQFCCSQNNGASISVLVKDGDEEDAHYLHHNINEFQFSIDVMDMKSEEDCLFCTKSYNFTDDVLCGGNISLNISYWITEATDYCLVDSTNCIDQVGTHRSTSNTFVIL